MKVLRISARDTYPIRHQVLRPGRPIETCYFDGDTDEQTFHLGAFVDSKLVSIASFFYRRNTKFEEENQYHLRGMATLPDSTGRGYSSELLKVAFPVIKQNFCNLVWCNARVSAQGFYEKVGFETHGEVFDVPDIGPHILMFKKL
ncbi:acetyltransferase, GNAT family [Bacteriovorax sp. BSW11_IV]|uniref:GNAT family N-acetyltransferase n=1 Tax=Bacteriovorax sp. BSW11_IV TaxID=1353529 RepID=UPI000389F1D3|nr:GNAT family N-acetyltransferase [Bacteriovorax sp. BSW11_IV]EQC47758.1 acetyltransferase, GNAT family [Bacteriovorax sp. BSW11_IV]